MEKNHISVETNKRIVIIVLSAGKTVLHYPLRKAPWFDVGNNFILTDRFFLYYDNTAGQILLRDVESSKLFGHPQLMTDLRFRPEQNTTYFRLCVDLFSTMQTTLV